MIKYHQGSSSHPDNAGWFPDTLSQMYRWVDSNWYSLYRQNSPHSRHLHTNTHTQRQITEHGTNVDLKCTWSVGQNKVICFHWECDAAVLTYYKKGSCLSTLWLDIQHVSRLGCTQPRLDKMFPRHRSWKTNQKKVYSVTGLARTTTQRVKKKLNVSITNVSVSTYTQRSDTQLATNGFGSMFSWQDRNGKKRSALHFSMASCTHSQINTAWYEYNAHSIITERYSKTNTAAVS